MLIRRQDAAMRALSPFAVPLSSALPTRMQGENPELEERAADALPGDVHHAELAQLQARLEGLETALDEAEATREAAVTAALEQGREEARQAADDLGAERLQALRDRLAQTAQECLAQLKEQGDLAVEIALAAIHKILGEASPRSALVEELVSNAIGQVSGGLVLAVRVSAKDFAAEEELAALASELGAVRIVRDADLPCGGCELELTLGTIDASLDVQLAALDRELGRLGDETP
jgi:flagellar assembly protein FliH